MDGLNKVILIGIAGGDVEVRNVGADNTTYSFSLATNTTFVKAGNKTTETEWHRIKAWNKKICEFIKKGDTVSIVGKIKTNTYEKDGEQKKFTEIEASEIVLLGRMQKDTEEKPKKQPFDAYENNIKIDEPLDANGLPLPDIGDLPF